MGQKAYLVEEVAMDDPVDYTNNKSYSMKLIGWESNLSGSPGPSTINMRRVSDGVVHAIAASFTWTSDILYSELSTGMEWMAGCILAPGDRISFIDTSVGGLTGTLHLTFAPVDRM
jgi:hypothetical protein